MLPKPPTCEGCPLHTIGVGFVPGEGPLEATMALVGQGPGRNEADTGRPFSPGFRGDNAPSRGGVPGAAGRRLNHWLDQAAIPRTSVYIDNVVRCMTPKNRAPTAREVAHCTAAHLYPVLRAMPNLRVVVPIGVPAMQAIYGPSANEWRAGSLELLDVAPGPPPLV